MKDSRDIAVAVLRKTSEFSPEAIARTLAMNVDDVVLALLRRKQLQTEQDMRSKKAAVLPEYLADNYFFSNPYGLDFHTWAGMQNTQEDEDVPTEPMPLPEEEEPPYDSETEASYLPNAPEESTEPAMTPEAAVPVPEGKRKKQAALLNMVASHVLRERGLLKAAATADPLRQKVEEFLRRKSAEEKIIGGKADAEPDSKYDAKQLAMGKKIEEEHTKDPEKTKEIAKDHLEEFPDYYSELKKMERRLESKEAHAVGRLAAVAKFGLDASELLGQDENRKQELHDQQVRHNEENHQIDLAKGQLELQQTQETFSLKQQQQQQKQQEQQQQQQMAMQMQQQQQQQMRQQYMSNLAGGGGQPTQGVQQPPQQGRQF